jgi:hypothetical protein
MNHKKLINDHWTYSPNARAEDGLQGPSGWRELRDAVLIPVGCIIAFCLLVLCL